MPASIRAMSNSAMSETIMGPMGMRRPPPACMSAAVQPRALVQGPPRTMYQMPCSNQPTIQATSTPIKLIGGMTSPSRSMKQQWPELSINWPPPELPSPAPFAKSLRFRVFRREVLSTAAEAIQPI